MKQQSELCKARLLFLSRGILNENIIEKNIMYSWVRSKLHHISVEFLNKEIEVSRVNLTQLNLKGKRLIQDIRNLNLEQSVVYLLNDTGLVLYCNNNVEHKTPEILSFSEEIIGTSAGGISIHTLESAKVMGCEHYNQELIHFVTETLVIRDEDTIQKYIVLVLTPLRYATTHDKLFSDLKRHYIPKVDQVIDKNEEVVEINREKDETNTVNPVNSVEKDNVLITKESSGEKVCKVFTLSVVEKNTVISALDYYSWNLKKTSESLGIGRSTLYRKIKEYGISKTNL